MGLYSAVSQRQALSFARVYQTAIEHGSEHALSAVLSSERERKTPSMLCQGLWFLSSDSIHPA